MAIPFVDATRQNHALEHATITLLLSRMSKPVRMVGRSTPFGFYVHGNVPTDALTDAAAEALQRLQQGEARLAVSPFCGTNIAVAGVLAGLSSALAFTTGPKVDRWMRAILAATVSVVAAQPLGLIVQTHLTTSPELRGLEIRRILRTGRGALTIHRVETGRARA